MRFLGIRLAAVAFAIGVVNPSVGHAQTAKAAAPTVQLQHVSIEAVGKAAAGAAPIVLIPGLSMPRESWRAEAERLKAHHRVLMVQLNGFGGSAPGENLKPGIIDGVVADLHAYVGAQKIQPLVVGHSLGGTIALAWAKAHPGDIKRAMIVDSLPWVALIMAPPTTTTAMIEPQAKAMRDAMASAYGKPADPDRAKTTMARLALKPQSQETGARWSLSADPRVTANAFYEDLMLDLRPDMAGIRVPLTLVYPWAAEGGVPKAAADALYRGAYAKVPAMTFEPIADSAHFVMLDQPAAFAAALDRFVGK